MTIRFHVAIVFEGNVGVGCGEHVGGGNTQIGTEAINEVSKVGVCQSRDP